MKRKQKPDFSNSSFMQNLLSQIRQIREQATAPKPTTGEITK